jgi:hypothetical protein
LIRATFVIVATVLLGLLRAAAGNRHSRRSETKVCPAAELARRGQPLLPDFSAVSLTILPIATELAFPANSLL